jgi:hypothetical protein
MRLKFTRLFTWLLLSLTTPTLYAQTIYFGMGGAIDYNSYIGIDNFGIVDYKGNTGYRAGFVLQFKLNPKLSFRSNLNYSIKRFREVADLTLLPTDPNTDPVLGQEAKLESSYTTRFIELPLDVMFKLNKSEKFDLVATIGATNAFQIGRKYKSSLASEEAKVYRAYLLGLKAGLGFLFKLDGVGIYIEPQAGLYLNQVHTRYPERNPIHFGLEFQLLRM